MSSIFKKIKSAFIIESAEATKAQPTERDRQVNSPSKISAPSKQRVPHADLPADGQINEKFTNILMNAIEENNQEGFDYLEFKRSVQNLKKMDMAEGTIYKSAFATAKTMGATPDSLIASAEHYVAVLQTEEDKFRAALEKQRTIQIEDRQTELKAAESAIAQKEAQIEALKQEIAAQREGLSELERNISSATERVELTGRRFVASYADLVKQIRQDIDNIAKYLRQ
ncbi:MAG: hypothetical protein HKN87_22145 [Saprospiraceae bacterium]|nr:hypothetical protein [Saprospiraceae bacterium]